MRPCKRPCKRPLESKLFRARRARPSISMSFAGSLFAPLSFLEIPPTNRCCEFVCSELCLARRRTWFGLGILDIVICLRFLFFVIFSIVHFISFHFMREVTHGMKFSFEINLNTNVWGESLNQRYRLNYFQVTLMSETMIDAIFPYITLYLYSCNKINFVLYDIVSW